MPARNGGFRAARGQATSIPARAFHTSTALAALWFFGFLIYCGAIPTGVRDTQSKVDGIVVVTGGSERVAEGLRLLQSGYGKELLVSGVAEGVDQKALIDVLKPADRPSQALLDCCVTLGHEAQSTADNAQEAARWAGAYGMNSIRLVTSNYHMNRSLLEFHRAMPSLRIVAHPVFPQEVRDPYWFANPRTLWLLVNEYHKSAAALARAILTNLFESALSLWSDIKEWVP